jgi:hypothetical protein
MGIERKLDYVQPRRAPPDPAPPKNAARDGEHDAAHDPEHDQARSPVEDRHARALRGAPDPEAALREIPPEERFAARVAITREQGAARARDLWRGKMPQDPFKRRREPPPAQPPPKRGIIVLPPTVMKPPRPVREPPPRKPPELPAPKIHIPPTFNPGGKLPQPEPAPATPPATAHPPMPAGAHPKPAPKPAPEDLTAAQQRLAELLKQADWSKTHVRSWHIDASRRLVSTGAQQKLKEEADARAAVAKARAAHAGDRARLHADAGASRAQHDVSIESLKARLEATLAEDLARIDEEGAAAKAELESRLDAERKRVVDEADAQYANIDTEHDHRFKDLKAGAEKDRADLRKRTELANAEIAKQAAEEQKKLQDDALRLKHEGEDQAKDIIKRGQDDVVATMRVAREQAEGVLHLAARDGAIFLERAKNEADAEKAKYDTSTPEGEEQARQAVFAILRPAQQKVRDMVIRAQLGVQKIDADAQADAKRITNIAEQQAHAVQQAGLEQEERLKQLAESTKQQAEAFIKQQQQRLEQELAKSSAELHSAIDPHRDALRPMAYDTSSRILREKEEQLAKIDAEVKKKRDAAEKSAAQARKQLDGGAHQNLKQLEQLVDRTCHELDRQVADLERSLEARVHASIARVTAWVDATVKKIAAEAEKALRAIDDWVKQAIDRVEADFAMQARAVDQMSKTAMAMVELQGAAGRGDQKRVTELEKHLPPEVAKSIEARSIAGTVRTARETLDKTTSDLQAKLRDTGSGQWQRIVLIEGGEHDTEVEQYKKDRERAEASADSIEKLVGYLDGPAEAAAKKALLKKLGECRTKEEADLLRAELLKRGKNLDAILGGSLDEHELLEARGALSGDPVLKASGALINALGNRHTFIVSWNSSVDEARVHEILQTLDPKIRDQVLAEVKHVTGDRFDSLLRQRLGTDDYKQASVEVGPLPKDQVRTVDARPPDWKPDWTDPSKMPHDPAMNKEAETLWSALDDFHLTGVPTAKVLAALKGKTPEQMEHIKQFFRYKSGGKELEDVLEDKLRGDVLVEAQAHLSADPVAIAVGELREAHTDGLFRGSNDQKIIDVLDGIHDPAVRQAAVDRYERETGHSVREMIFDKIGSGGHGYDQQIAIALLDDDRIKASSLRIEKQNVENVTKMIGKRSLDAGDGQAIYTELEKYPDPRDRARLIADYEARTHRSLGADLATTLRGAKLDVALALLDGKPAEAAAGRIMLAGDDPKLIYQQLQDKSDDQRKALIEAWNARYGKEKGTDLKQYLANTLDGLAQQKADKLLDTGKCPVELDLLVAMGGVSNPQMEKAGYGFLQTWGTDDDAIKALLQGKSKKDIAELRVAFEKLTGRSLDAELEKHLSGRSNFDVQMMMEGKPESPSEQLDQLMRIYKFERNPGSGLTDAISDSGRRMDQSYVRMLELKKELDLHGGVLTPEQQHELDFLVDETGSQRTTLIESKNAVSNALAMVATAVVGTLATVITGGFAGPVVAAIIGTLVGAGAGMAVKWGVQGGAYGIKDVTQDLAMALVQAVSAGLLKSEFVEGLKKTVGALTALGPETIGAVFHGVSAGAQSFIHTMITDKDAHNLGDLFSHAADAFGPAALSGFAGQFVSARVGGLFDDKQGFVGTVLKGFTTGGASGIASTMANPTIYNGDWESILSQIGEAGLTGAGHSALSEAVSFGPAQLVEAAREARAARAEGRSLEEQRAVFQRSLESQAHEVEHARATASDEELVRAAADAARRPPPPPEEHAPPPPSSGREEPAPIKPDRIVDVGERTQVVAGKNGVEVYEQLEGKPIVMVHAGTEPSGNPPRGDGTRLPDVVHAEPHEQLGVVLEPRERVTLTATGVEHASAVEVEAEHAETGQRAAVVAHPAADDPRGAEALDDVAEHVGELRKQGFSQVTASATPHDEAEDFPRQPDALKDAVGADHVREVREPGEEGPPPTRAVTLDGEHGLKDEAPPSTPKKMTPEEAEQHAAEVQARHPNDQDEHGKALLEHIAKIEDPELAARALELFDAGKGDSKLREGLANAIQADPAKGDDVLRRAAKGWDMTHDIEGFVRPNSDALEAARANIKERPLTTEETRALLDAGVSRARVAIMATAGVGVEGLTGENLAGACGLSQGRIANFLHDEGIADGELISHTTFKGSGATKFEGDAEHYFLVARMPDGQAYLIAPTEGQFLPHGGVASPEIGLRFLASEHGTEVMEALRRDGYVPLTDKVAQTYGSALTGKEGPFSVEDYLTTEQTKDQRARAVKEDKFDPGQKYATDGAAAREAYGQVPTRAAEPEVRQMAERDQGTLRNQEPLTDEQIARVHAAVAALGGDHAEHYDFSKYGTGPAGATGYSPSLDQVNIGRDVAAGPEGGPVHPDNAANPKIDIEGTVKHEFIGHREAALAGQAREDNWHEEAQASFRGAIHGDDLSPEQRWLLTQDAIARMREQQGDGTIFVWMGRQPSALPPSEATPATEEPVAPQPTRHIDEPLPSSPTASAAPVDRDALVAAVAHDPELQAKLGKLDDATLEQLAQKGVGLDALKNRSVLLAAAINEATKDVLADRMAENDDQMHKLSKHSADELRALDKLPGATHAEKIGALVDGDADRFGIAPGPSPNEQHEPAVLASLHPDAQAFPAAYPAYDGYLGASHQVLGIEDATNEDGVPIRVGTVQLDGGIRYSLKELSPDASTPVHERIGDNLTEAVDKAYSVENGELLDHEFRRARAPVPGTDLYLRFVEGDGPKTIRIVLLVPDANAAMQVHADQLLDESPKVRELRERGYTVQACIRPVMNESSPAPAADEAAVERAIDARPEPKPLLRTSGSSQWQVNEAYEAARVDDTTALTVRVHVNDAQGALTAAELAAARAQASNGVERYFNGRPLADGTRLAIALHFVDDLDDAHVAVSVHTDPGRVVGDSQTRWNLGSLDPAVAARSIGLQLGLDDVWPDALPWQTDGGERRK